MKLLRQNMTLIATPVLLVAAAALYAGPLNPPSGPITTTGKTLSEVEPRIAINAINTPGDADSVFRITQPGSYYLTSNLLVPLGKSGIEIAANNITIDLMGHNVQAILTAVKGISAESSFSNISIRNGTITAFPQGAINLNSNFGFCVGTIVENIHAQNNREGGIILGDRAVVQACTVTLSGNGFGIQVGASSVVSNCSVTLNSAGGISALVGSKISNCVANFNTGGNGGIIAGDGCNISNCIAYSNASNGITALSGCTVEGCTTRLNTLDGIACTALCLIRGNTCSTNGNGAGDGAGIRVLATDNRIEGNNCTGADRGIDVDSSGNIVIKNTCSGNANNWDVVAGNVILVVNAATAGAVTGNSGGTAPGSTDPNANFSY